MLNNHLYRRISGLASRCLSSTSTDAPLKTALYNFHLEKKGKMVEFAGYYLPVFYETPDGGIMKEHLRTRNSATIFDVSHMGQISWKGPGVNEFLEKMLVADCSSLPINESRLSLIMNSNGGIVDDTVISRIDAQTIQMVVNGSTKAKDLAHFSNNLKEFKSKVGAKNVKLTDFWSHGKYLSKPKQLIAIQGPDSAKLVRHVMGIDNIDSIPFMTGITTSKRSEEMRVTRCGYTGEDGFEISMSYEACEGLVREFLSAGEMVKSNVSLAGLGCRDSLRLEAGLCLYGHELDETIDPVSASLLWTIPKTRREGLKLNSFLGANNILDVDTGKAKKMKKKRVGFMGHKVPVREQAEIVNVKSGENIGVVTSGGFSPSLSCPIAMGYINVDHEGDDVGLSIRGKVVGSKIVKLPFVPNRYYRVK